MPVPTREDAPLLVLCTLCGRSTVLQDDWAAAFREMQGHGDPTRCMLTSGCQGFLLARQP